MIAILYLDPLVDGSMAPTTATIDRVGYGSRHVAAVKIHRLVMSEPPQKCLLSFTLRSDTWCGNCPAAALVPLKIRELVAMFGEFDVAKLGDVTAAKPMVATKTIKLLEVILLDRLKVI